MIAPVRMRPFPATQPVVRSWGNGQAVGRRPYVVFSCENLDEVEAAARAFLSDAYPCVIVLRDFGASTPTYRKLDLDTNDDAPGLYGGPTQRTMLRDACHALRGFLDDCAGSL